MRIYALLLAVVCAFAQQQGEPVLRVHVVDQVTRGALVGADVVLDNGRADEGPGKTDSTGTLVIHVKAPGQHLLIVTRRHYQTIGAAPLGQIVMIDSGRDVSVTVELAPLGILAGRVVDQFGDPVRGAIVRPLDERNNMSGGKYYDGGPAALTDDRGEYRIADVAPGRHYLAAEYGWKHLDHKWQGPDSGGYVVYPDATEISEARELEVAPGSVTRVKDLKLKIGAAVKITGWIRPAAPASVTLRRVGPMMASSVFAMSGESSQAEKDGTFQIEVVPGKYEVRASARDGRLSQRVTIDARERGVAGVDLTLEAGFEIRGHVVAEGGQTADLSKLSLNFGGAPVHIEANGNFNTNFGEPSARYHIAGLPKGWFVQRVSVAGRHIADQVIEVEQGANEVVFTLSSAGASVDIKTTSGGLPVFLVLLIPETGTRIVDELPSCQNHDTGGCHAEGVPPGAYRLFALDSSDYVLAFDPGMLMQKYRESAPVVMLGPGEHKTITVSPIKIQ